MEEVKPFIFQDDMLFESQFVRVMVSTRTKKYYEDLFNEALSVGQEIEVPVGWLVKKSNEKVFVICPRCNKPREVVFQTLIRCNNSFCNICSKQKKNDWMLGHIFGKLRVLRYGEGKYSRKCNFSTFVCRCKCGNEVEVVVSNLKRGNTTSCGCYRSEIKSGKNSIFYNSKLTDDERIVKRNVPEYVEWRKAVYERDNYTCKACSKVGGHLVAHHIVPYSTNKKLRFNVDNGITLCKTCHKEFHIDFMGGYKVKCDSSDLFNFIVLKKKSNP
jgi:hypothetical protein